MVCRANFMPQVSQIIVRIATEKPIELEKAQIFLVGSKLIVHAPGPHDEPGQNEVVMGTVEAVTE